MATNKAPQRRKEKSPDRRGLREKGENIALVPRKPKKSRLLPQEKKRRGKNRAGDSPKTLKGEPIREGEEEPKWVR